MSQRTFKPENLKKNHMKKLIGLAALLLAASLSNAQTGAVMVSTQPQFLLMDALRFDIDLKVMGENHWVQVGPSFISGSDNNLFGSSYDKVNGVGMALYHRIYTNKERAGGTYFAYGPMAQFTRLSFIDETLGSQSQFKYGLDALVGYSFMPEDFIFIDLFCGLGTRWSSIDDSDLSEQIDGIGVSNNTWDFGYAGNLMLLGLRMGVSF